MYEKKRGKGQKVRVVSKRLQSRYRKPTEESAEDSNKVEVAA
jgi:hypothetical protein